MQGPEAKAMAEIRLSAQADADILDILTRTHVDFGLDAQHRYELLIVTALSELAVSTRLAGVVSRPELGLGVCSYHLVTVAIGRAIEPELFAGRDTSFSIGKSCRT